MPKKPLLMILLYCTVWLCHASPCPEIKFELICGYENKIDVVDGAVTIPWAYETPCGTDTSRDSKFVVSVVNIFDEVLLQDTIRGFRYTIPATHLDTVTRLTIFNVRELSSTRWISIAMEAKETEKTIPVNLHQRLNYFLLDGYLFNAVAVLEELNRTELIPEIAQKYAALFPDYYPHQCNYFNAYLSQESDKLVTMPYVTGFDNFLKRLNRGTKGDWIKGDDFNFRLLISTDNQIVSVDIEEVRYKFLIEELVQDLRFENTAGENAIVVVKISKTRKKRKYTIANRRAMTKGLRDSNVYPPVLR